MLWDNSKNSCKPEDTILPGLTQTDKPCHELGFDFKKRQCSGFISRMRWKKKKVICIMNNLTSYVLYICISTIIHIKTPSQDSSGNSSNPKHPTVPRHGSGSGFQRRRVVQDSFDTSGQPSGTAAPEVRYEKWGFHTIYRIEIDWTYHKWGLFLMIYCT